MIFKPKNVNVLFALIIGLVAQAQTQTITKYLSGKGYGDQVYWDFYLSEGRGSGQWTKIPVPSCWELEGFGKYNYGHAKDSVRGKEYGQYRLEFEVPEEWEEKQIEIVFEGSMTDTEVKINGKLAGDLHQGSFYSFRYDISKLVTIGQRNLLEVKVWKHSANASVNKAERYADYWIFGGIIRPVFLEVKPKQNIRQVAIDAKADGSFKAEVCLHKSGSSDKVVAQVYTLDNQPVGAPFEVKVGKKDCKIQLETKLSGIATWNPEQPNLYEVNFQLYSKNQLVHETSNRFGFRTIEIRQRDGIYVNGVKIKFKGVNHHSFWPESGRTTNKQMSIDDILLMKEMNMNAVRTSHYPPDAHFLDACDSLGMFVLEELAGWHDAYDTEIGSKLLQEMVLHDQNHPSIVIWDNGNEGGHNPDFDEMFGKYDLQDRLVIHPWEEFNGTATQHYRGYDYGVGTFWNGPMITFPTEFLHGLYDGGSGASLYDYWELMWKNPKAAGGFLWVFADEGIVRTDLNGKIDTYGDKANDGILGPFHEKEASFYTIKEVWSPVRLTEEDITIAFDGNIEVENRYLYTNLEQCSFTWKLLDLPSPNGDVIQKELTGEIESPSVNPGYKGILNVNLPEGWEQFDVLEIASYGPSGEELYTNVWPITLPEDIFNELTKEVSKQKVTYTENESSFVIQAGSMEYTIDKKNGFLKKVMNQKGEIPFNNGPFLSAGVVKFNGINVKKQENNLQLVCTFDEKESRMKEFTWTFYPSGLVSLNIYYVPEIYDVHFDYMGVNFDYPEELVQGVRWMGDGPYRVWKNRVHGAELDVHQKDYNNTMTGASPVIYPEFKGYHANLYWAEIQSSEQSFVVGTSSESVFLRLFTPVQDKDPRLSPPFPGGDISFMQAIPPIGTKTNDPWNMGPEGKKNMFFDYGPYDSWRKRSKVMDLYFDFSSRP
ncbi:glycoside hydrolase family 2 TIM barrel-domain containing protein [Marinoscillum sp. MHG1-6]|uniref:glycoside hydrolase family 2 protein n=1 Tax=Marinoscillum sp. MHG1-6 TaxID=2959627 RepID=UPI002158390C|nr:glycoside hydrolase family 2 TIM barrel-domain containing protein [Marinoscillum sp. MHG1-6]